MVFCHQVTYKKYFPSKQTEVWKINLISCRNIVLQIFFCPIKHLKILKIFIFSILAIFSWLEPIHDEHICYAEEGSQYFCLSFLKVRHDTNKRNYEMTLILWMYSLLLFYFKSITSYKTSPNTNKTFDILCCVWCHDT